MSEPSPKLDPRSMTDQFMLLAVTPSMLVRLGLSPTALTEIGTASLLLTQGKTTGEARIFTISSVLDDSDDLHRELLTAQAFAKRMKRTHANIYTREKEGTLFSVSQPGYRYGRQYPVFQANRQLDGDLLSDLIALFKLHEASTTLLWDFLRSMHPTLGNTTGVEFLIGRRPARAGVKLVLLDQLAAFTDEQRKESLRDLALTWLKQRRT
jgi:hypothetical protein